VAAVAPGLRRGQVAVEVQEPRAGNVLLAVFLLAPRGLRELVAHVEHDPVRIVEVALERGGIDKGREHARS